MKAGQKVVDRARALVGTRFRPQGRREEHGLDCLGLVAAAGDLRLEFVPARYGLRSEASEEMLSLPLGERVKRVRVTEAEAGDVLLVQAGPGQHHFLILTENGFVHADACLRRVVETPGLVAWPAVAAWRILEDG